MSVSATDLGVLEVASWTTETYGYEMLTRLRHNDQADKITPSPSVTYRAIQRLIAHGLIEVVRMERPAGYPPRRIFAITPAGRTALQEGPRTPETNPQNRGT